MNEYRARAETMELHLVEAIENVERLLLFVKRVAENDQSRCRIEAFDILKTFGRLAETDG